jgi:hypothetical protein
MRTTLNIDDALMKRAKIRAIQEGITLTEYIERALRHECEEASAGPRATKSRGFTVWDIAPAEGIDLTSTSRLLEELEGPSARP